MMSWIVGLAQAQAQVGGFYKLVYNNEPGLCSSAKGWWVKAVRRRATVSRSVSAAATVGEEDFKYCNSILISL